MKLATTKLVKLYQDIQQNPELRKINVEVNKINEMIAKMGRSSYFSGISLPEQLNKNDIIQNAKENYNLVNDELNIINAQLNDIWNQRMDSEAIDKKTGIVKSGSEYIKTITVLPELSVKRAEKSGRGVLSEKAVRKLIADDVEMLKRLTGKSESEIMDFLNAYYEQTDVSGGQLLENFVKGVYKSDYAGSGASQSWGSATVKMIIVEDVIGLDESTFDYDSAESYETESKMNDSLYDKWINLFS